MGTLVVTEFVTMDGVAQAPGEPDEDRDGGFAHGGWQASLVDQASGRAMFEQANRVPKYVASRTLAGPLAWQGSTLLTDDLAESAPP